MKKGFTLIELLVSLIIISLSLVFISSFVLNLRTEKGSISIDIPTQVSLSSMSRRLNEDALKYGIKEITILDNNKLQIEYEYLSTLRILEISIEDYKTLTYKEIDKEDPIFVSTLNDKSFLGFRESDIKSETLNDNTVIKSYTINLVNGEKIEVFSYSDLAKYEW